MAKLSFLGEVVCVALFTSFILWQETTSSCPKRKNIVVSSTVTERRTTTKGRATSSISLGATSATVTEETLTTTRNVICNGVTCSPGTSCETNSAGQLQCGCSRFCPMVYDPVCGSNGKTYSNECMLRGESCTTNTNITVPHNGSCDHGCTFDCPFYGQCFSNAYISPTCVCLLGCPIVYIPVCGSNNQTYTNECELWSDSCQTNTTITVLHTGRCNGGSSCDGVTCPPDKTCRQGMVDNQPECICTTCPTDFGPVCGSDGRGYRHACDVGRWACQTNSYIIVVRC